jgi:hypothetical protein
VNLPEFTYVKSDMQTYHTHTLISGDGTLVLKNMAFPKGEEVNVIVEWEEYKSAEKNNVSTLSFDPKQPLPILEPMTVEEFKKRMKELRGIAKGIDTTVERDEDRV